MSISRTNVDPLALDEVFEEQTTEVIEASLWDHQSLAQTPIKVLRGHTDTVSSCSFCFEDTKILTSSHDKTAVIWDAESGSFLKVFDGGHSGAITECALTPDKRRLITASWDKTLKAWDVETGKILWTAAQGGLLTSCSISENGKCVVSASDIENAVYLTCAETGEKIVHIKDHHKSTITRCRFDPQSQHAVTVSVDRTIKLWDLVSQTTTLSINSNHTNVISNCCFTRNGRHLCTASWDKSLQLWDIQTGAFRTQGGVVLSKGHNGNISSCQFSDDSSFLVSGAFDKTVAVWDMNGPHRKLLLKGHADWVMDVGISADKKWVASVSKDTTLRLWNIENSEEISEVFETRKVQGMGYQVTKCEHCGKSFTLSSVKNSELITKCVFCRLNAPSRYYIPAPPCI